MSRAVQETCCKEREILKDKNLCVIERGMLSAIR